MYRCNRCGAGNPAHGTVCPHSTDFIPRKAPSLAERVERRLRAEWPGTVIPLRQGFVPEDIREGGATDTLIKLAARIIDEETL